MRTDTERYGRVFAVELRGQLTVDDGIPILPLLASVRMTAGDLVVLNLRRVRRLDCAGIGELVRLRQALQETGAALTLVNVPPRQARMLTLVGLTGVLNVCCDLDEALQSSDVPAPAVTASIVVNAVPGRVMQLHIVGNCGGRAGTPPPASRDYRRKTILPSRMVAATATSAERTGG